MRLPTLFHRLHFDWATHRPGVGLTVRRRRFQGPRHFYFTDYTLTGQPTAFPLHESESGLRLGGRVGLLVQPSFARRLPTFLHRLHFDWTTGRFLLREVGLRMQAGCPVGEAFARR
jgi:hypothetical protein